MKQRGEKKRKRKETERKRNKKRKENKSKENKCNIKQAVVAEWLAWQLDNVQRQSVILGLPRFESRLWAIYGNAIYKVNNSYELYIPLQIAVLL